MVVKLTSFYKFAVEVGLLNRGEIQRSICFTYAHKRAMIATDARTEAAGSLDARNAHELGFEP